MLVLPPNMPAFAPTAVITHPNGASMVLSEGLSTYLMQRVDKQAGFLIGHWLNVLDDEMLDHLKALAKEFQEGNGEPHLDDVLAVCVIAYCVETGKQNCQVTEALVGTWADILVAAVNIEGYRRKGWVVCVNPPSIRPDVGVTFDITASGMTHFFDMQESAVSI